VAAILCRSLVKVPGKNKANTEVEMEVFEAIKTRRSIRHYKSEAIAEEKLNAVLEAARWAPSWTNTQCWRFIVVRNDDTKTKLADALTSWNPAYEAVKEAPVVIVACAELGKSGFYKDVPVTDKGDWYMFDVALAMQNLALVAHSLGLGTVHVGAFDAQNVAHILNVPQGVVVVEVLPLGYPAMEGRMPRRKELSELVFQENYGQK
jgi:nitroreductase